MRCRTLIGLQSREQPLDEASSHRLIKVAEGNPLFLEEMLAVLTEEVTLHRTAGGWSLKESVGVLSTPPTIQALFRSRLDQLPVDERRVLECASIEGRHFHRSAILDLAPEFERSSLEAHLVALVRKDLIRPDEPSFAADEAVPLPPPPDLRGCVRVAPQGDPCRSPRATCAMARGQGG